MEKKMELRGRLDGKQRNRLKSLMNMMYRPKELAEEIGISVHQFYRVYIPLDCPHQRDKRNHIWINGAGFAEWYFNFYRKRKLREHQSFCLTCRAAVQKIDPQRHQKYGLIYEVSLCPRCGRKLAKIIGKSK